MVLTPSVREPSGATQRGAACESFPSFAAIGYRDDVQLLTAVASRPARGQIVSGDRAFVQRFDAGFVLAVVDALGHGAHADEVAQKVDAVLAALSLDVSVERAFDDVHRALRGTRGAAMTLVRGADGELAAAGVGNVGLRGRGLALSFTPTAGILGAHHRRLRVTRGPMTSPSRLVLFSDGISHRFDLDTHSALSTDALGGKMLSDYGAEHDDATVLVADLVSM